VWLRCQSFRDRVPAPARIFLFAFCFCFVVLVFLLFVKNTLFVKKFCFLYINYKKLFIIFTQCSLSAININIILKALWKPCLLPEMHKSPFLDLRLCFSFSLSKETPNITAVTRHIDFARNHVRRFYIRLYVRVRSIKLCSTEIRRRPWIHPGEKTGQKPLSNCWMYGLFTQWWWWISPKKPLSLDSILGMSLYSKICRLLLLLKNKKQNIFGLREWVYNMDESGLFKELWPSNTIAPSEETQSQ